MQAAEAEFSEHGFHGTVVRNIADRAGVGKGTVYRHFGDKQNLFGSVLKQATRELIVILDEILDQPEPAEKQLQRILDAHFEFFQSKRPLVDIVVREGIQHSGDEMESVFEQWKRYRSRVTEVFRQALRRESNWRYEDPELVSRLFLSWIWGHLRERTIFSLDSDPEAYRQQMLRILFGGLKPPSEPRDDDS